MNNITYTDFYTNKINHLTLQEALDIHYQLNPQFTPYYDYTTYEGSTGIKAHDIIHVIFGCDTSFLGEHRVQTWFSLACELKINWIQKLKYFLDADSRALLTPKGIIKYVVTHQKEMRQVTKSIREKAKQMNKKWDYLNTESYMNKSIGELRSEFNIHILPN
jgi:ubiquinone biosynthesis protein Coq4